ncbi:YbjN domain-containing protein [Gloeocapsopsis crepidinum LEGE 06123]|uniref:YbjN domain-containing protein n=1 Tax=Gloeocapsopsis crepidinum LEGE 06123 TaxID=588587 RepID=A0ABR9UWC4_9CHRO|nr:YbjN domain-containing protein [Gloeocapsopsis crepidinum]MBE9192576.1 YbjN domain-containing protein [Gloeocapsopsis crepidinum LEGE 06123]
MTSFQADPETVATQLSTNEMIDELLDEATSDDPVAVIQTVISSLEEDDTAMVSQTQEGHLWKFKYGSVEVFVQLTGLSDEDTLTVWSAVLKLPVKNEAQLMRRLMEMNWSGTFEACFGIFDEQIVVLASRTLAGVSPGEISRLITIVATIADDNDEALQSEFGTA